MTLTAPRTGAPPTRPAPRRPRRTRSHNLAAYLLLAPFLIGLLGLTAGPMVASLYLSLTEYDLLSPPRWIGTENYTEMFTTDERYLSSLWTTVVYVAVSVPAKLAFALGVALVLNRGLRGLTFYRAVYYVPSLLGGSVAIAVMWRQIFGGDGLVNQLLGAVGFDDLPAWIANPDYALGTLVALAVWQFGSPMVIFLAGLKQIPAELYEAAEVDGAGRWRRFRSITVPMLTPVIFFNVVLQLIGSFQAFTPSFIISNGTGGPLDSTLLYTLYLYQQGFTDFRMGYASAMAWVLLAIIAALTAFAFASSRYWVHYSDGSPMKTRNRYVTHALLAAGAVAMLYPVLWMVSSSLRPGAEIFTSSGLIPTNPTVENYRAGWGGAGTSFGTYLRNSMVICAAAVVGNVVACSMAAYAFARLNFRFRRVLFAAMLATIMLPHHVTLVPQYSLFRELGWINTYWPLIAPKFLAVDAFFIFLMVQFIRSIPRELDEAAEVDGCGPLGIYWRVVLPLLTPALITTAIFTFIWTYDDLFSQLIYLNDNALATVPVGLRLFLDSTSQSNWGAMFAMSTLALLPTIIVFSFFQKRLVEGIATSGVKG